MGRPYTGRYRSFEEASNGSVERWRTCNSTTFGNGRPRRPPRTISGLYTGLVHENGRHEYYFANDTEEEAAELREAAAIQLGMLLCVLADRSDSSIAEITEFAVDRAEQMELR